MRHYLLLILASLLFTNCSASNSDSNYIEPPDSTIVYSSVDLYLTKADKTELFSLKENNVPAYVKNFSFSIQVNPNISYQEMDGFGFTLTGGSALHLNNMSSSKRTEVLNDLFNENNKGVSYLRISIGASDLDAEVFSYNDLLEGETDENLDNFSIEKDQENLIPVLQEILAINPNIKIMGSPWSAPIWMKTNGNSIGGSLKPEYYSVYANYLVKYIKAYKAEGITIDAITIQNEPLHDGNNPSMYMEALDQADFIKNHLGPAFEANSIATKIIIYDHNADRTDYPISILNDSEAKKYIDGSAFHLYGGNIRDLNKVKTAHPDKNLYFTEQWVGANSEFKDNLKWHTKELIVGATRNWCKTVLEWNLASDSKLEPHTNGGCTECLGALTIDGDFVKKNVAYFIIAHASKFVTPGSVRIYSNPSEDIPNVAFKTPKGETIVIVLNNTSINQTFNIMVSKEPVTASLNAGSVGTFVWK